MTVVTNSERNGNGGVGGHLTRRSVDARIAGVHNNNDDDDGGGGGGRCMVDGDGDGDGDEARMTFDDFCVDDMEAERLGRVLALMLLVM